MSHGPSLAEKTYLKNIVMIIGQSMKMTMNLSNRNEIGTGNSFPSRATFKIKKLQISSNTSTIVNKVMHR